MYLFEPGLGNGDEMVLFFAIVVGNNEP